MVVPVDSKKGFPQKPLLQKYSNKLNRKKNQNIRRPCQYSVIA